MLGIYLVFVQVENMTGIRPIKTTEQRELQMSSHFNNVLRTSNKKHVFK